MWKYELVTLHDAHNQNPWFAYLSWVTNLKVLKPVDWHDSQKTGIFRRSGQQQQSVSLVRGFLSKRLAWRKVHLSWKEGLKAETSLLPGCCYGATDVMLHQHHGPLTHMCPVMCIFNSHDETSVPLGGAIHFEWILNTVAGKVLAHDCTTKHMPCSWGVKWVISVFGCLGSLAAQESGSFMKGGSY